MSGCDRQLPSETTHRVADLRASCQVQSRSHMKSENLIASYITVKVSREFKLLHLSVVTFPNFCVMPCSRNWIEDLQSAVMGPFKKNTTFFNNLHVKMFFLAGNQYNINDFNKVSMGSLSGAAHYMQTNKHCDIQHT